MDSVSMSITGLEDLERKLLAIGQALAKEVVQETMKKAAEPIMNVAKVNVPKRTGNLADSIKISLLSNGSRVATGRKSMYIGKTFYGGMIEFGTSKMQAKPFLRPAFDSTKNRALEIIIEQFKKRIEEASK